MPFIGEVGANISRNSGLGNTLIGSASTGGATVEAYYGPHGHVFDTNVSIEGALTVGIENFVFDAASIEISGNGFVVTVGGVPTPYSANNLSVLTQDLRGLGVDQATAEALTSALAGVIETLEALEDAIQDLLGGNGIFSIDGEAGYLNHDGNWEPIPVYASYTLNDEGDRLGTDQANTYTHTQDDGSFTIYDYSENENTQDVLTLEDVSASQVEFAQNDAHDLVITMSGGPTVTINNHFLQPLGSSYHAIELVTFSDGAVLTADEIADLIAADQSISGTSGDDTLDGTSDNDELHGFAGNDTLNGGTGDDFIFGGDGNDILNGQAGADTLDGGAGNDWLNGGWGWDEMTGGSGADRFYHHGSETGFGTEWISDFSNTEGDRLVLGSGAIGSANDFVVTFATTSGRGSGDVAEAFVRYAPTGQVAWAITDGADLDYIMIQTNEGIFDLLG